MPDDVEDDATEFQIPVGNTSPYPERASWKFHDTAADESIAPGDESERLQRLAEEDKIGRKDCEAIARLARCEARHSIKLEALQLISESLKD